MIQEKNGLTRVEFMAEISQFDEPNWAALIDKPCASRRSPGTPGANISQAIPYLEMRLTYRHASMVESLWVTFPAACGVSPVDEPLRPQEPQRHGPALPLGVPGHVSTSGVRCGG